MLQTKCIIIAIDRIRIWTDKNTLSILKFPEFDNCTFYIKKEKSYWSITSIMMFELSLKWFRKEYIVIQGCRGISKEAKCFFHISVSLKLLLRDIPSYEL
jgi:hypothetical protein